MGWGAKWNKQWGPNHPDPKRRGGLSLSPMGSVLPKNRVGSHAPQQRPTPPPLDVPQTKRKLSIGFMLLNPLPTKDENIHPVWGHSATQNIYTSPQTNEIIKSEVIQVVMNKWKPKKVASCWMYLALVCKWLAGCKPWPAVPDKFYTFPSMSY